MHLLRTYTGAPNLKVDVKHQPVGSFDSVGMIKSYKLIYRLM